MKAKKLKNKGIIYHSINVTNLIFIYSFLALVLMCIYIYTHTHTHTHITEVRVYHLLYSAFSSNNKVQYHKYYN